MHVLCQITPGNKGTQLLTDRVEGVRVRGNVGEMSLPIYVTCATACTP